MAALIRQVVFDINYRDGDDDDDDDDDEYDDIMKLMMIMAVMVMIMIPASRGRSCQKGGFSFPNQIYSH